MAVDFFKYLHVKFRCSVIAVKTVLLLLNVIKLSVAKTEHLVVVEKCLGKTFITLNKFFFGFGRVAVAPGVVNIAQRPFDSAVFAYKCRLTLCVFLNMVISVVKLTGFHKLIIVVFKHCNILLIVVNVKYICFNVEVTACVYAGTGVVKSFCAVINRGENIIILFSAVNIPRLVKRTPADDCGVVKVSFDLFEPLGQNCEYGFGP